MEEKRTYTIKEITVLWAKRHPGNIPTRQTIYNWAKRFGWVTNPDRLITQHKMIIDAEKFDEFNEDPYRFLRG